MKTLTHGILEALIPNSDLDFWNCDPKIYFGANLGRKTQSCLFYLTIGTNGISRMLIRIPTLVFWISYPKSIFGQISAKNAKVVRFAGELAHMVSWGSWFLFWHQFSEFQNLNSFLGKFRPKNSKLSIFPENWDIEYLEDADSYFDIIFLNFQT